MPKLKESKYRPYFTSAELDLLLEVAEIKSINDIKNTPAHKLQYWKSIKRTLQRTIAMINLDMAKPAYTTNPRLTINDRLGFDAPNFDSIMDSIIETTPPNPNLP